MTKYYERKAVSGTSNVEKLEEIVTSTVKEPKHIIAIWFTEISGTLQHDCILRAYVERERLVNMGYRQFLIDDDADDRMVLPRLEIDMVLPVGQSLTVGCVSGGTATDLEVVVEYEIV